MPPRRRPPAAAKVAGDPAAPASRRTEHFAAMRLEPEVSGLPNPDGVAPAFLHFDVLDVDLAIVNSLRRAIMADVKTASAVFDASGEGRGTIRFVRNTTALHNEFLGLRVSLVPIHFDENQLFLFERMASAGGPGRTPQPIEQFRFSIREANTDEAKIVNVTTRDIRVTDAAGAAVPQSVRDALFPPSPTSGDHILLVRLKPRSGGIEELHVEFQAQLGSGSTRGAAFSPVSQCFFRNKIDVAAFERSLAERIARVRQQADADGVGAASVDEAAIRRQHATLEGQRDFIRDEHGDASAFEFVLKSETRLRPAYIVLAGMTALLAKVRRFQVGLRDPASDYVHVTAAANVADFYDVAVRGEDHTLGNMVQAMLYRRWVRDGKSADVSFVGYSQPHPQEEVVVFKLKLSRAGDDLRTRLDEGLAWLQDQLHDLRDEWIRFSSLEDVRDGAGRPLDAVLEAVRERSTMAKVVAAAEAKA